MLNRQTIRYEIRQDDIEDDHMDVVMCSWKVYKVDTVADTEEIIIAATTEEKATRLLEQYKRDRGIK